MIPSQTALLVCDAFLFFPFFVGVGETWSGNVVNFAGADLLVFAACVLLVVVSFFGVSCGTVVNLTGDFLLFLFPHLRVTWVHPPLCWSGPQFPGSYFLLLLLWS